MDWTQVFIAVTATMTAVFGAGNMVLYLKQRSSNKLAETQQPVDQYAQLATLLRDELKISNERWRQQLLDAEELCRKETVVLQGKYETLLVEAERYRVGMSEMRIEMAALKPLSVKAEVECDSFEIITDWNEGAFIMFGWTREQMLGQKVDIIIAPDTRDAHHNAFTARQASGGPIDGKVRMGNAKHMNGSTFGVRTILSSLIREGQPRFRAEISKR